MITAFIFLLTLLICLMVGEIDDETVMDDVFEEDGSAVLSFSYNNECSITLDCHTPKPVMSSTIEKPYKNFQETKALDANARGSYVPVDKTTSHVVQHICENDSPVDSKCSASSFKDSSSLSVLEIPDLADIGKGSTSFLNSKSNSIGSWLDHCFSCEEADNAKASNRDTDLSYASIQPVGSQLTDRKHVDFSASGEYNADCVSKPPITTSMLSNNFETPGTKAHFDTDRSFDSEFEFNEDELDLEGLINEDDNDPELDETIQAGQLPHIADHQLVDKIELKAYANGSSDASENNLTTTFGFLRNLGFPVKTTEASVGNMPSQNISRLDSKYLVAASLHSVNESCNDADPLSSFQSDPATHASEHGKKSASNFLPEQNLDTEMVANAFAEFQSQKISVVGYLGFDDWENGPKLDFSGAEFKNDGNLQHEMFGNEVFFSSESMHDILNAEEESFKRDHQFSMNDNFDTCSADDMKDFSTCRTSAVTLSEDDRKVSIGTYMAERSEKLGNLSGKQVTERPSFGLKWQTPSPQKPCKLLEKSKKSSSVTDEITPQDVEEDKSTVDISQLPTQVLDGTVDKSMMNALSSALSNLSSNMDNDELAKFIVALSKKKLEYQNQDNKEKSDVSSTSKCLHIEGNQKGGASDKQSVGFCDKKDIKAKKITKTIKVSESSLNVSLDQNVIENATDGASQTATKAQPSKLGVGGVSETVLKEAKSESDLTLDGESKATFSPDATNSNVLTSTLADLSLTRGSISRESIEKLHKKLRLNVDQQRPSVLPDVVFPHNGALPREGPCNSNERPKNIAKVWNKSEDVVHQNRNQTDDAENNVENSFLPLSQSSPDRLQADASKLNDSVSRGSSAFQQLLPSTSFNEMATIPECSFGGGNLLNSNHLETIKECDESALSSRSNLESLNSKDNQSGSCSSQHSALGMMCNSDVMQAKGMSRVGGLGINSGVPQTCALCPCSSSALTGAGEQCLHSASHKTHPSTGHEFQLHQQMLSTQPMSRVIADSIPSTFAASHYTNKFQTFGFSTCSIQPQHDHQQSGSASIRSDFSTSFAPWCRRQGSHVNLPQCYSVVAHAITVPSEMQFENTLCIGVPSIMSLPVRNNSPRWMQVEVCPVSLTVSGQQSYCSLSNYVTVKKKHIIEPYCIKNIDISVNGRDAGVYLIVFEVKSSLVDIELSSQHLAHTVNVNIHACVAIPSVCMFGTPRLPNNVEQASVIDFGEIPYGSVKSMPLRILNESKVDIPLRLVMHSRFHDCCSLYMSTSPVLETIEPGLENMQVLSLSLPVGSQPKTIWVHIKTPTCLFASSDQPKKIEAKVEAVLDISLSQFPGWDGTFHSRTALDTAVVSAVLGAGKLHAPRCQQAIEFFACKSAKQARTFPVKNAGNISVHVEFFMENYKEYFTIHPVSAFLHPDDSVKLTVEFCAPSRDLSISSSVIMKISPGGPQFEVKVKASVVSERSNQSALPDVLSCFLTNRTLLRWGGVLIGQSMKNSLSLRSDQSLPFVFRASIKEDKTSSFQIATVKNGCEELTTSCDLTMIPGEDMTITVLFAPSKHKVVKAKLELKTPVDELPASKYTIPLSGYGGVSQINLKGLQMKESAASVLSDHRLSSYVLEIKEPCDKGNFIVHNAGSRAAFVKIAAFSDNLCKCFSKDVSCHPAEIVLQPGKSHSISVNYLREKHLNLNPVHVYVWHGDELLRQFMKKNPNVQSSTAKKKVAMHLRTICFVGTFDGEDLEPEEELTDYKPHSVDVQLFYAGIRQNIIQVIPVQEPPDALLLPAGTKTKHGSGPRVGNDNLKECCASLTSVVSDDDAASLHNSSRANWHVTPTHVTLEAPNSNYLPDQLTEPYRLKIVNKSLASLVFDVVWPGHFLTVTPNRGRVEAESATILLLSANPSLASREDEVPWCGQVMVVASAYGLQDKYDNVRVIHVQIKSTTRSPASAPSVNSKIPDGSGRDILCRSPAVSHHPFLQVTHSIIDLGDLLVGNSVTSQLEFRNMAKCDVNWLLTSFAPAYVKQVDSSGDLFRCSYAAFVFSRTSGTLESGACIQVPVTFNPMNVGLYTQHWEIEYHKVHDHSALSLQKEKISLQGQCIGVKNKTKANEHVKHPFHVQNEIFVTDDVYTFEKTLVGKSSVKKVPIKNRSKTAHTVKFLNIHPPFYTTRMQYTIRPMHCASLPVTFKPVTAGEYIGSLHIQPETGDSINVTLKARAA